LLWAGSSGQERRGESIWSQKALAVRWTCEKARSHPFAIAGAGSVVHEAGCDGNNQDV